MARFSDLGTRFQNGARTGRDSSEVESGAAEVASRQTKLIKPAVVADLFVTDSELLPAFHIGGYNRLGIQLAKDESLLVVAVVNEGATPIPFPWISCR